MSSLCISPCEQSPPRTFGSVWPFGHMGGTLEESREALACQRMSKPSSCVQKLSHGSRAGRRARALARARLTAVRERGHVWNRRVLSLGLESTRCGIAPRRVRRCRPGFGIADDACRCDKPDAHRGVAVLRPMHGKLPLSQLSGPLGQTRRLAYMHTNLGVRPAMRATPPVGGRAAHV